MFVKIPPVLRAAGAVLVAGMIAAFFAPGWAGALPWDVDMYSQESYRSNEMARAPAKGTVPVGGRRFSMTIDEAATALRNPTKFDLNSVWRGRRLWNANCLTCHGPSGKGKGPVGPLVGAPDLLTDFYSSGRTDGRIFAVVFHGQGAMPRYGYKFSDNDIWSLVNYLRFLQGRDVDGMARADN